MKNINKNVKKIFAMILTLAMFIVNIPQTFADNKSKEPKGYVTISVEKFTLGQGYIKEPVKVPFYDGESVAHLITRLLGDGNYTNTGSVGDTSGSVETGFYLASVKDGNDGSEETNIPQYILDAINRAGDGLDYERIEPGFLGEFDYTFMSGWMYCVNNWFPNYGSGTYYPKDGDVIRWQFTTHGYGMDIGGGMKDAGGDGDFTGSYVPIANKDSLTAKVAEINSANNKEELLKDNKIKEAYETANNILKVANSSQVEVDKALASLEKSMDGESKVDGVILTGPDKIEGNKDKTFDITIKSSQWPNGDFKLLDTIISIPDFVEVVEVSTSDSLSGGAREFNANNNKLRIVYTNTNLANIVFDSEKSPNMFTIRCKLKENIIDSKILNFKIDSMNLKSGSSLDNITKLDVNNANIDIEVTESNGGNPEIPEKPNPSMAGVKVLFEGDGLDLIPKNKKAVAISFLNAEDNQDVKFSKNTKLYYSKELTDKLTNSTYVAIVDNSVTIETLENISQYTFNKDNKSEIINFGDVNYDESVNAQDALNILTTWLRTSDAPDEKAMIVMNVTGDSKINTSDALGIMEKYVNGDEYTVLNKAS